MNRLPSKPTANYVEEIILSDPFRVKCLKMVAELKLPDCWIGAGFARNKVWDVLSNQPQATPIGDIDVIYFDAKNIDEQEELKIREKLLQKLNVNWSVKNQARMHTRNGDQPYRSCSDAIQYWPEICTAIAVRWLDGRLEVIAPFGFEDLFEFRIRPTPHFRNSKMDIYRERQLQKNWPAIWSKLEVEI